MEASGQLLSGIVRVGKAHSGWGTDYEFQVTWSAVGPETAFLHGLVSPDGEFSPAHRTAVLGHIAGLGFTWAEWVRLKDGREKPVRVRLGARYRTGA